MNGMNGMVRGTWKTRALKTVRGHGMVHFDAGVADTRTEVEVTQE
jgi:hypothetical protein